MKDQYVTDIGDYGKYSLLKAFADAGVKVGINWYYTDRDGRTDGKFTKYLDQPERFRKYCPDVFDALKGLVENDQRKISAVEEAGIVPGACYYNVKMAFAGTPAERREARKIWFQDSKKELRSADLVYLDPDNGLLTNDTLSNTKIVSKYALPEEVEDYYNSGKNVVYYCHKGRRSKEAWEEYKAFMLQKLSDAKQVVLTYHKGTQRSHVFLVHSKDQGRYFSIIDKLTSRWDGLFTIEDEAKRSCA